jgi:hypothetical protein
MTDDVGRTPGPVRPVGTRSDPMGRRIRDAVVSTTIVNEPDARPMLAPQRNTWQR